jgi:myosin heavy subunit
MKTTRGPAGLGSQFKSQLGALVTSIEGTTAHFVRCIKPNSTKTPGLVDHEMAQRQLITSGVMDAVTIRHLGYSERLPHASFLERYTAMASSYFANVSVKQEWARNTQHDADTGAKAARLLQALTQDLADTGGVSKCQRGKTKLFYKRGVLLSLERRREMIRHKATIAVQRRMRGVWARRECAAKLLVWRRIKSIIDTKRWDQLEKVLGAARALGFTESQLAVVLADYRRLTDLSNAQGFVAHALALVPTLSHQAMGITFRDSLMALAPALDKADTVAKKYPLEPEVRHPLSLFLTLFLEPPLLYARANN